MKVGDLVTVTTLGWEKIYRVKYENRVGVITAIVEALGYTRVKVNFGEGDVEMSEGRIRLLEEETENT